MNKLYYIVILAMFSNITYAKFNDELTVYYKETLPYLSSLNNIPIGTAAHVINSYAISNDIHLSYKRVESSDDFEEWMTYDSNGNLLCIKYSSGYENSNVFEYYDNGQISRANDCRFPKF